MTRVHIICEGQTEEMFVAEVLAPEFVHLDIYLLPALVGKPGHKGGNLKFEHLLTDVRARLGDSSAFCTTFFDFYGLPSNFSGKEQALQHPSITKKAACIKEALTASLATKLDASGLRRFIPYVQMYEFEGLLFSAPEKLAQACENPGLIPSLIAIRQQFPTPEDINNSPHSAPSKRILQLQPGYDKPLHAAIAALDTGLDVIRRECGLFNQWLNEIAALPH